VSHQAGVGQGSGGAAAQVARTPAPDHSARGTGGRDRHAEGRWRSRIQVPDALRHPRAWLRAILRDACLGVLQAVHFRQPENTLISSSRTYWGDLRSERKQEDSHWRGAGRFEDDARWLALGQEHFEIYEEFSRAVNFRRPRRIAEWGCGGGINAVRFGPLADVFYGIDISPDSLQECARQTQSAGLHNFTPVLIDAANPEAVLTRIESCDLVISTYVFEALPSPEYGVRVLRIIGEVLSPGGMAVIQTKYKERGRATASRRWNYARNLAWNATYRIEEFWQLAKSCGLSPKMVKLQPEQPLVSDRNYAYFCLRKVPEADRHAKEDETPGRVSASF